jgi:hypothetical protein
MSHRRAVFASVAALLAVTGSAPACGFINEMTLIRTFREDAAQSKLLVYGQLTRFVETEDGYRADCEVESVLKAHPILGKRTVLVLPRVRNIEPKTSPRMLIFCDVEKGKVDAFRGVEAPKAIVSYLQGLIALDAKDHEKRLLHCFASLEHDDPVIADDAFKEFMKTPDKELGLAARRLVPEKLRGWLKKATTPEDRLRMYGFLLGNCGRKDDALLLRQLAEKIIKKHSSVQIDGVLTGYVLLAPKDGWSWVRQLTARADNPFTVRYSGLRAARFFHNTRPDVIGEDSVLQVLRDVLDQPDMADLAIEDLRGWKNWKLTGRVLGLYGKATHESPLMRRCIIRYALQCSTPEAARFIDERRKDATELVEEVQEALDLEKPSSNRKESTGYRPSINSGASAGGSTFPALAGKVAT